MRPLGGILRPSRNQVTCGRGKLAIRGARMTAASPWDTLWRFSPSSKFPMSAEGKSTRRDQGPRPVSETAQLLRWESWQEREDTGRMTMGQGDITPRPPLVTPLPLLTMICPALCFWGSHPFRLTKQLIHPTTMRGWSLFHTLLPTWAQRGSMICPRTHAWEGAE